VSVRDEIDHCPCIPDEVYDRWESTTFGERLFYAHRHMEHVQTEVLAPSPIYETCVGISRSRSTLVTTKLHVDNLVAWLGMK